MTAAIFELPNGARVMGTITDDDLTGCEWVMRSQIQYFGEIERRPVSMQPDANGMYFVDHGTPLRPGRSSAAWFKDGEWLRSNRQPWKMKPTRWSKVPGLPVRPPVCD